MDCTGCLVPDNAFLHVALTLFMFCVSFSALIAYQIFALQSLLSLTNPPPGEEGDTTGRRWTMETLKRCFPPPWAFPSVGSRGSSVKAWRGTGSAKTLWFGKLHLCIFCVLRAVSVTQRVYMPTKNQAYLIHLSCGSNPSNRMGYSHSLRPLLQYQF